MAAVKKGVGIFKLDDSDHNVGSLFSFEDTIEILHIIDVDGFHTYLETNKLIEEDGFIDEMNLYKNKYKKEIKTYMNLDYVFNQASWDEYVLCALIRRTYPDAEIEQQAPVTLNGRKTRIDIKLYVPSLSKTLYIEVDGTTHFVSYAGKEPKNPRIKLANITKATGCEAYSWPFWIQRSSHNLKVLLGQETVGYGALWTSNVFFSYFYFENSSEIIKDLNKPFDVDKDGSIGYFYEANPFGINKPEHFVLDKIRQDKESIEVLIPKGTHSEDINYWLPREFQK